MKVDIHVHSIYSNNPTRFLLRTVKAGECYTTPRALYDTCLNRGMDMVTITDHDTIEGALEIADLPGTFVSEEVTAVFPGEDVSVHVLALDISEDQHAEIQRVRTNIYDLVTFLRAESIAHVLAHPLSRVIGTLTAEHVEKLFLMFRHLEGRNGTRDALTGKATERIVAGLDAQILERWANKHKIEPVFLDPVRYLTGGSDDHGRLNIARAHTLFDTEKEGVEGLKDAFFAGRVAMGGCCGSPQAIAHSIYATTFKYFQHNSSQSGQSALSDILNFSDEDYDEKATYMDRRIAIAQAIKDAVKSLPDFNPITAIEKSHTDEAQEQIGELGQRIVNNLFRRFVTNLIDSVGSKNLERAFDNIPGVFTASSVILPYVFGYRYIVRDREEAERLANEAGFGFNTERPLSVGLFSDTGYQVNGVSLGLRRLVDTLRRQGRSIELCLCATIPEDHVGDALENDGGVKSFQTIGEFELPMYKEVQMGIPSLVDIMNYLAENDISVVQVSTPGPLGVVTLLAAKIMGLPVVSNYHTEFPAYAARLTGDKHVTKAVRGYIGWFYRQVDHVIVPSESARTSVVELGVPREQTSLLPRGVNIDFFHPKKRNPGLLRRAERIPALLYVGRISKEKGLDALIEAYETLRKEGIEAGLTFVGEGPYLEELQERYEGREDIAFLGYRRGEELASLFASCDVFVFPSPTDTFGNVVIEAQASGVPTVVSDTGGPAEQTVDGDTGLVFPADDAEALADRLRRLLRDPALRERLGRQGRQRAQSLSLDAAASAQWGYYEGIWGRACCTASREN